jgi:diguanylate cyclase (GGDEF)-like protein
MPEAPLPYNEQERLEALRRLNLLDTPIEERFERITRMLCRLLRMPIASFTLVDESRQWFKSIQGLSAKETPRSEAFCAHTILENEPLIVDDATKDPRFCDNPLVTGDPNIGFYAGMPVRSPDGHRVGTLCVIDRKPRTLSNDDVQTLRDLAAITESELRASIISKSQAELINQLDTANRLALVDPLTRLWNRNGIFEILKREWAEAKRSKRSLAVAIGDIDFFKTVNDTHGHAVGDEVLEEVGRRLVAAARTEDAVGRIGGEEFLLVLPNCPNESLKAAVERIRIAMCMTPVETSVGKLAVTLSFGAISLKLGVIPGAITSTEQMVKVADEALYAAKRSGRNNVQTALPNAS